MVPNAKKYKKPNKALVAATLSKANPYLFARLMIRDREVGGSNPLDHLDRSFTAIRNGGRSYFVSEQPRSFHCLPGVARIGPIFGAALKIGRE